MYADISFKKILNLVTIISLLCVGLIMPIVLGISIQDVNPLNIIKPEMDYLKYKLEFYRTQNPGIVGFTTLLVSKDKQEDSLKDTAESVPVLLYHGVVSKSDGSNIMLDDFKNQMFALKKEGYQTITLEDFYLFIKGQKILPEKSFLLTFDDGRKDSYYPVDPILKTLSYNAVIFVITERSLTDGEHRSTFHLSEQELKKLLNSGRWEIQSHSSQGHNFYNIDDNKNKGHFFSNRLWLENKNRIETQDEFNKRIFTDLIDSKNELENAFKIKVTAFALPFGDFGQNSVNIQNAHDVVLPIIESVYPLVFYQIWPGISTRNYPNPSLESYFIKRINVEPTWDPGYLIQKIENGGEKTLPYRDELIKDSGWISTWGNNTLEKNKLILKSTEISSGALIFLDGTQNWANYRFNSKVHTIKGDVVTLIANYEDELNYDSCVFSTKYVKIEQTVKGTKKTLAQRKGDSTFVGTTRQLGISTNNNQLACYIDSTLIVKSKPSDTVKSSGGIGFKIWDPILNNSEIEIKNVSVEPITF